MRWCVSVCVTGLGRNLFPSVSFNHSDISPFRINYLQARFKRKTREVVSQFLMCRDHLRAFPV